jgi:hypothetical protein
VLQNTDESTLGKITTLSRTLIQHHLNDGSDNESVVNGEQSSPYMSNAITSSPTTASIAPTGDGVSFYSFIS